MFRLFVAAALIASASSVWAQPICAPPGFAGPGDQAAQLIVPEPSLPRGGAGMFVVDVSRGMSGFIRNARGASDDMIFRDIVVQAVSVFSQIHAAQNMAGDDNPVYALVETALYGFAPANALEVCKNALSTDHRGDLQKCPRSTSGADAFMQGANLKALLGALDPATPGDETFGKPGVGDDDLVVIITDLQNESEREGAGELGELLKALRAPGIAVAVMPFRSLYSGWVFDLPGLTDPPAKRVENGIQPFFLIAVGGEGLVDAFLDGMRRALGAADPRLSLRSLFAADRARPPMRFGEAHLPPEIASLPLAGTPLPGYATSSLRILDEHGRESHIPLVAIDRSTIPASFTTISALGLRPPQQGRSQTHCLGPASGSRTCLGGMETTAPAEISVWVESKPVRGVTNLLNQTIKRMLSGGSQSPRCGAADWTLSTLRTPFAARAFVKPHSDESRLTAGLHFEFHDDMRTEDLYRGDTWLVSATTTFTLTTRPKDAAWLVSGRGWNVDLAAISHGMSEPVGVGGLARFVARLSEGMSEAEQKSFDVTRSIAVKVER